MNTSVKKILIFALADGIASAVLAQSEEDDAKWRAKKLKESATHAIKKTGVTITQRTVRKLERKIENLNMNDGKFNIITALSLCLLGLMELQHYANRTARSYIDPVLRRTMWFIKLYDPKLEDEELHAKAMHKYIEWLK